MFPHRRSPALFRFPAVWLLFPCLALPSSLQAAAEAAPAPEKIVRDASWNELHAGNNGHPFRYRVHDVDSGKSTVKEHVEARDGDVSRLLEKDGKPLSASADAAERARLEKLRGDPEAMAARRKKSHAESVRENEMIRLLPEAFTYTLLGMVSGPNGPCYRLGFAPNPAFNPPDRQAEVYHGMAGELWIDQAQQRIVRLDAHLIADVDFGWGIAGRLYKGGTILVEERDVGDHHWETTHEDLNLHGKILLVKSLDVVETEDYTDFAPVPDNGYQAAITYLLSLPLPQ